MYIAMTKKLLPQFKRELNEKDEPSNHQRKFLYLPLPVFRDFTNICSIVIDGYVQKKFKQPTNMLVEVKIEKYHKELGQLNKWKSRHLDKLEFLLPQNAT